MPPNRGVLPATGQGYTDGSGVVGTYITTIPVIAKIATITAAQINISILFTVFEFKNNIKGETYSR
ncbi:hypothetical protein FACS189452_07240 [Bacteroidia bacterium]|nr:hypothetical protein FACS189452_07240 [Bacteroidia bacterium]